MRVQIRNNRPFGSEDQHTATETKITWSWERVVMPSAGVPAQLRAFRHVLPVWEGGMQIRYETLLSITLKSCCARKKISHNRKQRVNEIKWRSRISLKRHDDLSDQKWLRTGYSLPAFLRLWSAAFDIAENTGRKIFCEISRWHRL